MESRSTVEIPFLNEAPLSELLGAKLPTGILIFRHFWYHHKVLRKESKSAIRDCAKSVKSFWEDAGLVPKKIDCIIKDIDKWYKQHQVQSQDPIIHAANRPMNFIAEGLMFKSESSELKYSMVSHPFNLFNDFCFFFVSETGQF